MFPHEQGPQNSSSLLRKHRLPPLCLPKQRHHLKSVGGSISFQQPNLDSSRYLQDTIPEQQCFRSRSQRSRGESYEEESGYPRTRLPSMSSLMPSHNFQLQPNNSFDTTAARQHSQRQVSSLNQISSERHEAQLPLHERTRSSVTSAISSTKASNLHVLSPSFTGLSAIPTQPIELQRNRVAKPLNIRHNRWSPYASTWVSVARGSFCDLIAISWEHAEDQNKQPNFQRRRTSPRRRLAASKVRAQAFQMQELAEVFDHFETNRIGYDPAMKNDGPRFVPSFSTVSSERLLPMLQSSIFVNDSTIKQNNQRIKLREWNERTNKFRSSWLWWKAVSRQVSY